MSRSEDWKRYRQTHAEQISAWRREYESRPEVRERRRVQKNIRNATPEARAKRAEYYKTNRERIQLQRLRRKNGPEIFREEYASISRIEREKIKLIIRRQLGFKAVISPEIIVIKYRLTQLKKQLKQLSYERHEQV